jgi:5-oxoprolinase (ATP-hydrolysing)
MLNAPYNGGTHLPDITVVTPVFDEAGKTILFYVASRGHHADVGGMAPGSMTPRATTVDEEGVLIDNFKMVDTGASARPRPHRAADRPPLPVPQSRPEHRRPEGPDRRQRKGRAELRKMVAQFGLDVVQAYMNHVQDNAEESVRRVIDALPTARYEYPTDRASDQGEDHRRPRQAARRPSTSPARRRSSRTTSTRPSRWPRRGALRVPLMVEDNIPMNAGCLKPINIVIPDGCMLRRLSGGRGGRQRGDQPARHQLPVRRARRRWPGQGTMNNLTFGNAHLPVLRDDLLRLAGGWARFRRHVGRAHPHDQHAADRPGNPRNALPGGAGGILDPRGSGGKRQVTRPA